ncbi:hypothetical protein [Streptococcus suis]
MYYIIFSFEIGDYLSDEEGGLLLFDSRGLACQYLQSHYQRPIPVQRTNRKLHLPDIYDAPFKIQRAC